MGSVVDVESAEIEVKRDGKVLFYVTLAGPEHPKRKALAFNKQRRLQAVLQRTGKLELTDPEEMEQEDLDTLVASTLAWREVEDAQGNPLPCTPENVRAFYSFEGHGWIRKYLKEAMEDRERFIKGSAVT
jgi:hypothetical protein